MCILIGEEYSRLEKFERDKRQKELIGELKKEVYSGLTVVVLSREMPTGSGISVSARHLKRNPSSLLGPPVMLLCNSSGKRNWAPSGSCLAPNCIGFDVTISSTPSSSLLSRAIRGVYGCHPPSFHAFLYGWPGIGRSVIFISIPKDTIIWFIEISPFQLAPEIKSLVFFDMTSCAYLLEKNTVVLKSLRGTKDKKS